MNEMCGLRLADFGEQDGTHFIHFQALSAEQSLKTEAGNRIVPIHHVLKKLGLGACRKTAEHQRGNC